MHATRIRFSSLTMFELAERRAARDAHFMEIALRQARLALESHEVPVGAVVVHNGELLSEGHNRNYVDHDPSAHAEIIALRAAGLKLKSPRLSDCTLYVTLEPCAMCVGALLHARITRLVFGAYDPKAGACGTAFDTLEMVSYNHRVEVTAGVLAAPSQALLQVFFSARR